MGRHVGLRWRATAIAMLAALLALALPAGASPTLSTAPPFPAQSAFGRDASPPKLQTRGAVNVRELLAEPSAATDGPVEPLPFLSHPDSSTGAQDRSALTSITAASGPVQFTPTAGPPLPQLQTWAGASAAAASIEPPDPWVGVGPDHVLQAVNVSIRIWDRRGTGKLAGSLGADKFFGIDALGPAYRNADPRFVYDEVHRRWVGTEVSWTCDGNEDGIADDPIGFLDFVVSRTADPLGTWDLYFWWFENELPDYPAPGWSTDKLGFTANMFAMTAAPNCTAGMSFVGGQLLVVDWADVIAAAGSSFPAAASFSGPFTPRIATQLPATSPALHVMAAAGEDPFAANPFYARLAGSVVSGTVAVDASFDLVVADVLAPLVEPPAPMQPGPDEVTAAVDARITDAIWKAGRLTFVSTNGCTPTGDTIERTCVRVSQLNTNPVTATTPPSRTQDFLIAENGADHYLGGIGQSGDGTLHVVWTRSSTVAGNFPSSMHGYQLRSDPANRLSAPRVLAAGTAAYTGNRWGDYVGVAQDPQVPNAVWQGNQYSAGASWATRVSQLQTPGSTYVPITPIRTLDTRPAPFGPIGLSGKFNANTPRSWQVAGFGGGQIPSNAIAVTGNLTVTGQTAKGYVSVTPTPVAIPTSSTINFPLGDTRANNVTIPVGTDGKLSAVFRAASGATHLIFDVTGYFVGGSSNNRYNPITPFRKIDSRYGIGMPVAKFRTREPRTFTIAGVGSIPAGAKAVTGNLTVVRQSHAGFLAVTPDPVSTPTTSNLNFPVGDVRANGLTAPLNAAGKLSIVYVGPTGATTDVVLDITGYYLAGTTGLVFHPLNPGRIFDTRTSGNLTGMSGMLEAKKPRQLATVGHWGVAHNAGAITGNLTVTGQQQAGYVSVTTTSQAAPTTSTLNFPLGDTRANGITVPLNGTGGSWYVYVAGDGKKTHLLLDVSGYFAP